MELLLTLPLGLFLRIIAEPVYSARIFSTTIASSRDQG